MRKKIFIAWSAFFLTSSCVHYSLNPHYVGPKELPKEITAYYSYESSNGAYNESLLEETPAYFIKRIELPAATCSDEGLMKQKVITLDYYEIKDKKKTPVIIVLPILGGNNSESKIFCRYFATHGYASLIVHRDQKQKETADLEHFESSMREMVIDHRLVIDWIETQAHLDATHIGVFGVSMGGIKAALLTGLDARVKASVIALAGGDIPYILLNSSEKGIRERIDLVMKERSIDKNVLYKILKTNIRTDPMLIARYIDARRTLIISPVFDHIVPYRTQRNLRKAIGGPEHIELCAGHYTSILYIWYVRHASFDFFKKTFAKK